MFLLVGLGNPGSNYENTRHNIGFKAVDAIVHRFSFVDKGSKFNAQMFAGEIANQKIIAIKPQTFMNRSGQAVGAAARFYKIALENILVIHDDLDLPVGKIKAKIGGGSGGQNGIKDIDRHMGQNYRRIRLGIGHPGDKSLVSSYVLKPFASVEQKEVDVVMTLLTETIEQAFEEAFPNPFTNAVGLKR